MLLLGKVVSIIKEQFGWGKLIQLIDEILSSAVITQEYCTQLYIAEGKFMKSEGVKLVL